MSYIPSFILGLGFCGLSFLLPTTVGRHGWSLALAILARALVCGLSGAFIGYAVVKRMGRK